MASPHRLTNKYLEARFSPEDGNLIFLAAAGSEENLVVGSHMQYFIGRTCVGEKPGEGQGAGVVVVDVSAADDSVESTVRTEDVAFTRRFTLRADSPLLEVGGRVRVINEAAELRRDAFPHIEFAPDFVDMFEDERDLYFDGVELGGGPELPPWRVFYRRGYERGLLAATRSKLEMSRFQILASGFDIRPHAMVAYDASVPIIGKPMTAARGPEFSATFEIGPWTAASHEALIEAAGLNAPHEVDSPPLTGAPLPEPEGIVFDALDFAGDAAAEGFSRDRWRIEALPFCRGGRALMAGPNTKPPALTLDPKLSGVHRIILGIGNGNGVTLKLSGDGTSTFRHCSEDSCMVPFGLRLAGEQRAREVVFKVAEMDGRALEIGRFPNSYTTTVVDYVRFEELDDAEADAWRARQSVEPGIPLSGFNDIPDIARFTDVRDPDPEAYRDNLRAHAECGIRKVYWRIDGQCSDYPSKLNTMRYVSAKVHGIFSPQSKAYGRALRKTDMLRLAVDAARDFDLDLYGWMRFNNYTGNVQSDFFKQNPRFHEEWDGGYEAGKLCLAWPEVRKHKIDILVEAASYGLAGVNLGFMRHPPVLVYAPILVESYEKKYGAPPPRDRETTDAACGRRLPPDTEEHRQWYGYRAAFLTQFGRELRAALRENGLAHVKVSLWVRANHCLFDGIDLETWLAEGLCDEVVADRYCGTDNCEPTPEWRAMVQARAPLRRCISGFSLEDCRREIPRIIDEGYDGITIYESDYAVLDSGFIDLFDSLRG